MRVNYKFHDKAYGDFIINAEVSGSGRVQVITVEDDHGTDIDFDDFTDVEKGIIREMARAAAHELDSLPDLEDE
jgi:hypothetical protein